MTKLTSYVRIAGSKKHTSFYHNGEEISAQRFNELLLEYSMKDPSFTHKHHNNIAVTEISDIFTFAI